MNRTVCLLLFTCWRLFAQAQQVVPLYVPGMGAFTGSSASITVYRPETSKGTGTAVLVIPGGAYSFLATSTEGVPVAQAFAGRGVTAFVLKYTLPAGLVGPDKSFAPLRDAQQAIRMIRENAVRWNIDPKKIGVIGFSAGGHLASSLETMFAKSYVPGRSGTSLRPDFAILVYPVVTMDSVLTHMGSRVSLLGERAPDSLVRLFSSERQVGRDTPPTYITHAGDDGLVGVGNSILMYQALLGKGVDAELHLYARGGHGFIQRLPVSQWLDPMLLWMKELGFD